jgi:branched-chain amino acid transport system ATP-binding protein
LIDVRDVCRTFGGIRALDGVTLSIPSGQRVAIIGPNGAGKTTLINVLTGELRATSGVVRLDGEDIGRISTHGRARRGLGRMYQRNELFDPLTARENVAIAVGAVAGPFRPFTSPPARERHAADALLDRVGLSARADVRARDLSHGERRQLELAVTLARGPRVLLLDEPTAGMSPAETARIVELIAALERSLTLLIVEHDMDVVFRVADRIAVLHEGRVIADGTPDAIRADRQVHDVYLGKAVETDGASA